MTTAAIIVGEIRFTTNMPLSKDEHDSGGVCPETRRLEAVLGDARGLVFDCDGTLLDTMPLYFESWSRACDEVGLSFPLERFYSYAGRTVHDIFQTLIDEQVPINNTTITAKLCEDVKRRHHAAIEAEGRFAGPIDVVVDIAFRYKGKLPMAVASSGWRDHVISGLERVGILHLFDEVVTACDEEVHNPKPAPDIFIVAAKRIGVEPFDCVGFEDADLGMVALRHAGYLYACDVRLLHMYPRNVEERLSRQNSKQEEDVATHKDAAGTDSESGGNNESSSNGGNSKRGTKPNITLSMLSLVHLIAATTALSSGSTNHSTRRNWITTTSGGIASGALLFDMLLPPNAAADVDALPSELRQYTALAPLGAPTSTGSKLTGLSLSAIAARLSRDLTQGTKGRGGYFVTGDLSTELFRDDCVFVDPTNSVTSLSRYANALRILFDPEQSSVKLIEPLVVNERERTISGRVRSWGVLQLPWKPRIASYETTIVYTIDENGLIESQVQEWSVSASEALQETFTPGSRGAPFSQIPRPNDEPAEVTELFDIVNGHRQDSYPQETRFKVSALVDNIAQGRYPWKRDDLPGKWSLVYLQPGPDGGGIDRRIPFPDLWFNNNYQVFTRESVTNIGELLGPLLEVRVGGSLQEIADASLSTPKRFQANINKGELCFGTTADASCIPLPISGEGLFDGVYLGERLRIGQNLNGGGARVVQVKLS